MISRSALLHIRLPFSLFLLPVFMMALVVAPSVDLRNAALVFAVMHIFLYTASNGFNSYYDRDEESIGGLRRPPPVSRDLLWFSLALDGAGLLIALIVGWKFALGCFIYGTASKVYSWNVTRIKKYGIASWLFVGLGQGTCTFLLIITSITAAPPRGFAAIGAYLLPAISVGFFLLGVYPLTQIYQHREDARRNDMTISRMLGITRTFLCAGACMVAAIAGLCFFFDRRCGHPVAILFLGMVAPAVAYFLRWFSLCLRDPARADFDHCMRMNIVASTGINLFGAAAVVLLHSG